MLERELVRLEENMTDYEEMGGAWHLAVSLVT